jgi:hypothetical protein
MALSARQITLVASTPTPLLVLGSGTGTTFKNIAGNTQDTLPVQVKNEDSAAVVYIGGPDVSATNGQSLPPGQSLTMNLYGSGEIPYAFSTGTPIVSMLLGRQ